MSTEHWYQAERAMEWPTVHRQINLKANAVQYLQKEKLNYRPTINQVNLLTPNYVPCSHVRKPRVDISRQ